MNENFKKGYDYYRKNATTLNPAYQMEKGVEAIEKEISKFSENMNNFKGYKTDINKLKGDIAEFWHGNTFNIKSAIKGSSEKVVVDRSHDFASPDIIGNTKYSIKYYQSGKDSAKAQVKTFTEDFKQNYKEKMTLEEYLSKRGIKKENFDDSIYNGQVRIIPTEQLKEATEFLKRKIAEEELKRPELVAKYKETLKMLDDRIREEKGLESIPLTKDEAEKLAKLAKEGNFDPKEFGITIPELMKPVDIFNHAFKSGVNAVIISLILKIAPDILLIIKKLIKNGEIKIKDLKDMGISAIKESPRAFLNGSVAAALTVLCEGGFLGESLKKLDYKIIGAATYIMLDTLVDTVLVMMKKKTNEEMIENLLKNIFISSFAYGTGVLVQSITVPVLGYMLGNLVGTVLGNIIYTKSQNMLVSFFIENEITLFGIVKQDYKLPKSVFERLGLDTYEYDTYKYDTYEYDTYEYDTYEYDTYEYDGMDIVYLERGIIGVRTIGYI